MKLPFLVTPKTIFAQIVVIVVLALLIVVTAGPIVERWLRDDYETPDIEQLADRLHAFAIVLKSATPDERETIIAATQRSGWDATIEPLSLRAQFAFSSSKEHLSDRIIEWLFPPDDWIVPLDGWRTFLGDRRIVATQIDDASMLVSTVATNDILFISDFIGQGTYYVVAILTLVFLFCSFAIWSIMLPLRRISHAAINADLNNEAPIFEERGSREIIVVARALNNMRNRISVMIESRTRMLRGISHDLRTPLTRLRMRAERLSDGSSRDAMLSDIDRLNRLLTESLDYLRDNHRREATERTDLASLVKTVCTEFADIGSNVEYRGPNRLIVHCPPLAMARAITNLCDNATKFGQSVLVELRQSSNGVTIDISDDGPGVSATDKQRILEPFFKADAARTGPNDGFGLGLSIVAEIVQAYGGRLDLLDCLPQGLRVRLELPFK
ncbi:MULTISPECIES: ATP-binding protein [Agrobacterium]|uniref:ATP-binding protein n=1 Tax=Agrobacterium TaxID=357 RepID=UPI002301CEB0|nr:MULTISPECIES: ATP-binding protein [Agrobacterium]MDA5639345.1 ATP-binding protein [Agrobacterium sp. ST15.13.013]MDA6999180.1 ATP-binding protein [Agrobacterium salinitolerans]